MDQAQVVIIVGAEGSVFQPAFPTEALALASLAFSFRLYKHVWVDVAAQRDKEKTVRVVRWNNTRTSPITVLFTMHTTRMADQAESLSFAW